MLTLHHLTIGYPRRTVCTGLCATLEPGLTALLAPNGKGKSTLLRTMASLLPPLEGSVTIGGNDIAALSPCERARTIAVVLTRHPAPQALTARDVVRTARLPHTTLFRPFAPEDRSAVERALTLAGAAAFADTPVAALSDGQRQRVYIAKALAQETPVVLLDEPTAFLDARAADDALCLLRRIAHDEGKTILLTTHHLTQALLHADRLWMLHTASIASGTPAELLRSGQLDAFFPSPAATLDKQALTLTYHITQ